MDDRSKEALEFIKAKKKELKEKFAGDRLCLPCESPFSIFILDATFADSEKSRENVLRSINRNRHVEIYYLYQDPKVAWEFTLARERVEGRVVPKEIFIDSFLRANENVNKGAIAK